MKLWTINAVIEAENDLDAEAIAVKIDADLNRGDGIYMRVIPSRIKRAEKKKRKK